MQQLHHLWCFDLLVTCLIASVPQLRCCRVAVDGQQAPGQQTAAVAPQQQLCVSDLAVHLHFVIRAALRCS